MSIRRASFRRRSVDVLIAVVSATVAAVVIVAIDGRSGDQLARVVGRQVVREGGAVTELRDGVLMVTRSAWDLSYVYGPLMTFAAVALVLVLFMLRSR